MPAAASATPRQASSAKVDNARAWQLIAGVYMPISDNIDLGLKYRYFRTGKLNFNDTFIFAAVGAEPAEQWRAPAARRDWTSAAITARIACSRAWSTISAAGCSAAAPAASASAASARGSGDADVPGRLGDPGDEQLPGAPPPPPPPPVQRRERGR